MEAVYRPPGWGWMSPISRFESRYHLTLPAESTMMAAPWVRRCAGSRTLNTVSPLDTPPGDLTITGGRSEGNCPVTRVGPSATAESPAAPQILTSVV